MYPRMLRLLSVMAVVVGASASSYDVTPRVVYPGVGEYFYIGTAFNWTEAVLLCLSSDAHLLVIDSTAEAAAARDMMTNHGATNIHLGFHDQFIEGKYNNILGKHVQAPGTSGNEWAVGSPKGGTTYNCGGFSDAGITDTSCAEKQVFICEVPSAPPVINPDYVPIQNFGYYKFVNVRTPWTVADQDCRDDGANLIILESQAEADAMGASFSFGSFFHVGVHRRFGGNDVFVTVLGDDLRKTGYTQWRLNEPSGSYTTTPYLAYRINAGAPGLTTNADDYTYICKLPM